MKKLALIVCWLGKFPKWHNLYLLTCLKNPEVDWLIFHDQPTPQKHPPNVIFHTMRVSELESRAAHVLKATISIHSGYKLCDLRPAYGAIFDDFLAGYLFWGYADNDVFFGRIRTFITDQLLTDYDVLTACRCCTSGQFTIFRNEGLLKEPHKLIRDYTSTIQSSAHSGLDEIPLDNALQAQEGESIRVYRRQLQIFDVCSEDWRLWAERLELKEKGNLYGLFWEGGATEWNEGTIRHLASNKEAMFMHFMTWKRTWLIPSFPYWPQVIRKFVVTESGIQLVFQPNQWWAKWYFALRYQAPVQTVSIVCRLGRSQAGTKARRLLGRLKRWGQHVLHQRRAA
jgi:hypothetical protein